MITLNKLAYRVLESIRGNIGADENIDIRQIKFDINTTRAVLLRNEFNQKRTINPNIIQSLGCIDVEDVDQSMCCEGLSGCVVKRTTVPIPGTIEMHSRETITKVGSPDLLGMKFNYVTYETAMVSGNGRFNANEIFAFSIDGYMYFVQKSNTIAFKAIDKVNVLGVFENPEEVEKFSNCDGSSCYNDDSPYPISEWMINYLIKELLQLYLSIDANMPSDENINNKFELKAQQVKK